MDRPGRVEDGDGRDERWTSERQRLQRALVDCKKRAAWCEAQEILGNMRAEGFAPGVKEYTACISACAWASQSDAALKILHMMGHDGVEGDSFTYAAALAACARCALAGSPRTRCDQAQRAATIVEDLRTTRPDVFANRHVLTEAHRCMMACGDWEAADRLLCEIRAGGARLAKLTTALVSAKADREAEVKLALTAEENAALCDAEAEKARWRLHKRRSQAKRREEPHATIDAIDLPDCASAYSDLSTLVTAESTLDWGKLPSSLDPAYNGFELSKKRSTGAGARQPDLHRAQRKRWQVESFAHAVYAVLSGIRRRRDDADSGKRAPIVVVDFGSGSGNVSLPLAWHFRQ